MSRLSTLTLLFLLALSPVFAQERKAYNTTATDLKQAGWNKVLCMKNGNTMLFHLEPTKPIALKVYDSTHKEIADLLHPCRLLDIFILKDVIFKGLYDINGEAVLFLEQEHNSKNQLLRLRFNGNTGKLVEELLMGESQGMSKKTKFYVMKNKGDENYAIFYCTDAPQYKTSNLHVTVYNKDHGIVKDVPIAIDRKKYDYLDVISAESQPNGICVSLSLSTLETNGTRPGNGATGSIELYNHYYTIYYIAKDSSNAIKNMVDVTTDVFPYYANYTYNPFSKSLNLLMLSYQDVVYRYGLELRPGANTENVFFKLDESSMDMNFTRLRNTMAENELKHKTDTGRTLADALPVKLYTNENGLSTLISESYSRYVEPESNLRTNFITYISTIAVTQFDDDGNEIWGTVLPCSQYYKSYHHYYDPKSLSKKWQEQFILSDLPEEVYNRQFCSINTYTHARDLFIVYNDDNKNFNNSIAHPGDTVYDFSKANACYYRVDRKREVTKKYLFGDPVKDEYRSSFIEGADYDEQRGIYAALVQYRKDNEISLQMAWAHLD